MKLPAWLYLKREGEYDVIWRVGRRPLVYTLLRCKAEPGGHRIPNAHLFAVGRLHVSYGVVDSLTEGLDGIRVAWRWIHERDNGLGFVVAWGPDR